MTLQDQDQDQDQDHPRSGGGHLRPARCARRQSALDIHKGGSPANQPVRFIVASAALLLALAAQAATVVWDWSPAATGGRLMSGNYSNSVEYQHFAERVSIPPRYSGVWFGRWNARRSQSRTDAKYATRRSAVTPAGTTLSFAEAFLEMKAGSYADTLTE